MIKEKLRQKCDLCNSMLEAANAGALARIMGLHKRTVHGIAGKYSGDRLKAGRIGYWIHKRGLTPEQAEEMDKKYMAKKAQFDSSSNNQPKPKKPMAQAEPMALTACPFCHARFYGCRGEA